MTHTTWLVVLGFLLASNPLHRRSALPLTDRPRQTGLALVAAAAMLTVGVLSLLALVGGSVLDGLDISIPNARVAVGLVLLLAGAVAFARSPQADLDAPAGSLAALFPTFFPVLLRPELTLLALVAGADQGWFSTTVAILVSQAAVVAWAWVASPDRALVRLERGVSRLICVALMVLAVDLVADGVLAV